MAGQPAPPAGIHPVHSPYDGHLVGTVSLAGKAEVEAAIHSAIQWPIQAAGSFTRFARHQVLDRTRQLVEARREELARLITSESGLCSDGRDNDNDSKIDCEDNDCNAQTCNDGVACNVGRAGCLCRGRAGGARRRRV